LNPEQNRKRLKRDAAEYAVQFVKSGMVVGLGHGTTAIFAIQKIAQSLHNGTLADILAIPCSAHVDTIARQLEIPLTTLDSHPVIDVTIDEVTSKCTVIKGGGGALLREKIVAQATQREIIVVDESKLSDVLGTRWAVPLEVVPFGLGANMRFLQSLGANVSIRRGPNGSDFWSDQGNLIVDAYFGPIKHPEELARCLASRAGIIEHGLFLNVVSDVIIAGVNGIDHWQGNTSC
jgi:ribose 5-phosphate isomerase A